MFLAAGPFVAENFVSDDGVDFLHLLFHRALLVDSALVWCCSFVAHDRLGARNDPRSPPRARCDRAGPAVRTSICPPLRPRFDPRPAGGSALVAVPPFAVESARWRRHIKMTLSSGHSSGAGVPRHVDRIASAFTVRA